LRFLPSICFGLALSLSSAASAQSPMSPPPYGDFPTHVGTTGLTAEGVGSPSERHVTREARVLKKGLLAPAAEDRSVFAAFLQQPNSGLVRLMPVEVFNKMTSISERRVTAISGFSYSFVELSHSNWTAPDISLKDGSLNVGIGLRNYGMMTKLGDVALDNVSLSDTRVGFISSYQLPISLIDANTQAWEMRMGFTKNGANYSQRLPAEVNTTYLLRSIINKKTDALVALRVVRKDPNGSVTIAWKLLKKFPQPKFRQ
jgi:hypothetical protein